MLYDGATCIESYEYSNKYTLIMALKSPGPPVNRIRILFLETSTSVPYVSLAAVHIDLIILIISFVPKLYSNLTLFPSSSNFSILEFAYKSMNKRCVVTCKSLLSFITISCIIAYALQIAFSSIDMVIKLGSIKLHDHILRLMATGSDDIILG